MKHKIIYITSFKSLGVLGVSLETFFKSLGKNFNNICIVNIDNLSLFSKSKKFKISKKIKNKFPKKFKFEDPLNFAELDNIVNEGDLIINNISGHYKYFNILYFLSRRKNSQIVVSNIGNVQGSMWYYWDKNVNYYISLITTILPKKITAIFTFLGIFRKIDIRFTSNKYLHKNFYRNKKKFLARPSIYKEMILVKSNRFEEESNVDLSNEYITLLDFQPDYSEMKDATGDHDKRKVNRHYENTIIFLNKIRKIYKKEIAICIHPLYDLKRISKIYKNFKVYKFRTKEFIKKSFLVLFYDSSSIIDAIINKKRIIALKTDLYKGKKDASSIYTDIIPFKTINISKSISINKLKLKNQLDRKIPLYNNYLKEFAQVNQKEKGNEKIIRIIKKKFFNRQKI